MGTATKLAGLQLVSVGDSCHLNYFCFFFKSVYVCPLTVCALYVCRWPRRRDGVDPPELEWLALVFSLGTEPEPSAREASPVIWMVMRPPYGHQKTSRDIQMR